MGVFDFLKRGGQGLRGGPEFPITKETRDYDQLLDELMIWNIHHTNILEILQTEINEERLTHWSQALEKGVRKGLTSPSEKTEANPLSPVYLDLYRFVRGLRTKLLLHPTMKNAKGLEKLDSISVCIICGIRALQKEKGAKRLINTFQWRLLERYLGHPS